MKFFFGKPGLPVNEYLYKEGTGSGPDVMAFAGIKISDVVKVKAEAAKRTNGALEVLEILN